MVKLYIELNIDKYILEGGTHKYWYIYSYTNDYNCYR